MLIYIKYSNVMIHPLFANQLRSANSSQLVAEAGPWCAEQFDHKSGIPVVIAARNEEEDLPATLAALARSDVKVSPIVVENGSQDDTALFAKEMGALVLQSDIPAKMAALQLGIAHVLADRTDTDEVLFTDADTLVGSRWAGTMNRRLGAIASDSAVLSAAYVFSHGEKGYVDVARSVNVLVKRAIHQCMGRELFAAGANMALRFGSSQVIDAYQSLDPMLFIGEERAIVTIVRDHDGGIDSTLDPRCMAVTRGDRVSSLLDGIALKRDKLSRADQYPEYGDFHAYED